MANPLYIKGSRTRVLNTFPTKTFGKDGDIVISRISGKGVFLCTKAGGMWYIANKMEELKRHDKATIPNLKTNSLSINKLINAEDNTDKILVSDTGIVKYRTSEQVADELGVVIKDIDYKQSYCSLGQYTNKEDCEANNGTWYYSDNDSHDSISSTAENELLTVASSLGKLDAESTLLYDGSTLEIKRNTDFDDNWQTSTQTNLLKLSYDSSNNVNIGISSSGVLTIDSPVEILSTSSQLKLTHNTADYATFTLADTGDLTIATVGDGTLDSTLELDADGQIVLNAAADIVLDADGADIYFRDADSARFTFLMGANQEIDVPTGNLTIDVYGDIVLDAGGGQLTIQDGGADHFLFDCDSTAFTIYDDTDAADLFSITVGASGITTIATVDDGAAVGHLTLDVDGDIILDSHTGVFIAKKAGTEFSAANSAYAGMILGYTDIGLNETHAAFTLAAFFVVPTDEFSVEFTIPPSGNVLIELQIQHYFGSSGLGDLYAGLSTANATSGYSALASYHEKKINDAQGRNAVDIINISWTLTGLTAGDDEEIWAGFKVASITGSPTLTWGGNGSGRYPDFIMKATALPATITT